MYITVYQKETAKHLPLEVNYACIRLSVDGAKCACVCVCVRENVCV